VQANAALKAVHGKDYQVGCIPCLLYIASGGSSDWALGDAGIPYSMAMELRDGTTSFRQKTFRQKTFRQTTFCQKIFCQKTFRQKVFSSKDVSSNDGSSKSHFRQKIIFVKSPVRQK
jgi:hypothetical protein